MSVELLSQRIAAAGFRREVLERMRIELSGLVDAPMGPGAACVDALVGPCGFTQPRAAAFEALWNGAELFLRAALYVVLSEGDYTPENARKVGFLAQRLGWSAHALSALEEEIFAEVRGIQGG